MQDFFWRLFRIFNVSKNKTRKNDFSLQLVVDAIQAAAAAVVTICVTVGGVNVGATITAGGGTAVTRLGRVLLRGANARASESGVGGAERLHLPGGGGVRRLGGLVAAGRRLLLLHHAVHHRFRRPRSGQVVPARCRPPRWPDPVSGVLRLFAYGPRAHRHRLLARARGGNF
jgi:hypothetical protein